MNKDKENTKKTAKAVVEELNAAMAEKYGKLTLHGIVLSIASIAVDVALVMKFITMFGVFFGAGIFIALNVLICLGILLSNATEIQSKLDVMSEQDVANELAAQSQNSRILFKTIVLAILHFVLQA